MCSVEEDIEELNISSCSSKLELPIKTNRLLNRCRKCSESSVVVLQKKDPFCKSCFIIYCSHKFKAAIGKSKLIRPGNRVLIAYSGGPGSVAMLHMVKEALDEVSHKKLLFIPGILHIDESFIAFSDCAKSLPQEKIFENLKALQYPVLFSSLEMVLRENDAKFYWNSGHSEYITPALRDKLCSNIANVKSSSARQDYLECLRLMLIKDIAKDAGYSHIFVGDCANHLAVKLLSNIAMGRGSQISFDMRFSDHRSSVAVCRPMREFSKEEITQYIDVRNIPSVISDEMTTKNSENQSIQQLTEKFVNNLQENFPATVYTIFRTGSKVSPSCCLPDLKCLLCESPRDNVSPIPCSALEALSLSAKLSERSCQENETRGNGPEDSPNWLEENMCHGCQVILSEMEDCSDISPVLRIKAENNQSVMRKKIQDYIIE